MGNIIKYSTTGVTNTVSKGNLYLGVNSDTGGPTSTTGFWNGIQPPLSGYTLYGNKNDAFGPSINVFSGDSDLISFVNQRGGNVSTISGAINYFSSNDEFILVNKDYEPIVTSGLILNLDASFSASYPKSGTTWYDLSLSGNNGTLAGSFTFDNNIGGNIIFNGTSTSVGISDIVLGNGNLPWTVSAWIKTTTTVTGYTQGPILTNNSGGPVVSILTIDGGKMAYWPYYSSWIQNLGTITVNDGNWHLLSWVNKSGATMDLYVDGVYDTTIADSLVANSNPVNIIGSSWVPTFFNGQIANIKIYNKALTQTEITQNYNASFYQYTNTLRNRVQIDSGYYEDNSNYTTEILKGIASIIDRANLVITPTAYKEDKIYSIIPKDGTGDFTVVRTTDATMVNKLGLIESVTSNIARLDYPTTGGTPSILIEPQRTNSCTYSLDMSNASWFPNGTTVTASATTSPDGTTNAVLRTETALNAPHLPYIYAGTSVSGTSYTWSVFAKKAIGGRDWLYIDSFDGTDYFCWFNISTGAIGTVGAGCTASIKDYGNGWYRCAVKRVGIGGTLIAAYGLTTADNIVGYTGDGASGMYFWGYQLENGAEASSYIPTTAASVTRNADEIYKIGISSLIPQPEGSIFVDCIVDSFNGNPFVNILNTERNTSCSFAIALKNSNEIQFDIFDGGVSVVNLIASDASFTTGQRLKILVNYKTGNSKMYVNGLLEASAVSAFTLSSTWDDIYINDKTTYFAYQGINRYEQIAFLPFISSSTQSIQITTL